MKSGLHLEQLSTWSPRDGPEAVAREAAAAVRGRGGAIAARLAGRWPGRVLASYGAAACLALYVAVVAVTGGPLSPWRALVALPLIAAAFLPGLRAAPVVGVAVLAAVGPLAADRTWPGAGILPHGAQAAAPTLVPELLIQLLVFVGLRLVLEVRDARREAAVAGRVAAATAQGARAASDHVDVVLRLTERLSETFDRQEILGILVAELKAGVGTDAATLRLLDGDVLRVVAQAGLPDDVAARLPATPATDEWFHALHASRGPVAVADVEAAVPETSSYLRHAGSLLFASAIAVPLWRDDVLVGVLTAISARRREWTQHDLGVAAALGTHASIAFRNADLFARTQAWAAQLGVVQAASARMSRQNTVESVGRAIVEETASIIDYHNCRVYLYEPPDNLNPIAFEGRVGAYEKVELRALQVKVGCGFTGWVAEHVEPLLIPDANADPRGQTIAGTDDVDESMVVVPMRYDERLVGVITLSKLGLGQFDEGHLRLMTILADQAATALESARLLGRSQALARELGQLRAMGNELAQTLDPRQVADLIARHVADALRVEECAIGYWDRSRASIVTWGYHPFERREQIDEAYSLAAFPLTRRVLDEQTTIEVRADDETDTAERAILVRRGDGLMVMLPLVAKGASIGLVELISKRAVSLDAAQLQLARTMANEAAMALENARLYEDARMLADRDPLTGFLNHRSLHERLGEEVVRAQRSRAPLGLLMLDLDDFKLVNDTFGHQFGDRVLLWAAELIRSTLRASDVAARYGGDEFAVLLPDTDLAASRVAAARIAEAFRDCPYLAEGHGPVPIGVSIGSAAFPRSARNTVDLIASADAALYQVKKARRRDAAGPTRRRVWTPAPVRERVPLEEAG